MSIESKFDFKVHNILIFPQLEVNNNQLSGSFPSTVNSWEALEELNITNNQITGPIPYELGELKNLKSVDLSFNFYQVKSQLL